MFLKKYGDVIVGIFYAALGIALIIGAGTLPKSKVMEIGPDFMPRLVGIIILVLALLLLFWTIKGLKKHVSGQPRIGHRVCEHPGADRLHRQHAGVSLRSDHDPCARYASYEKGSDPVPGDRHCLHLHCLLPVPLRIQDRASGRNLRTVRRREK